MHLLVHLKFLTTDHGLGEPFTASYDWWFILLSYLVISLAAFTGVKTVPLLRTADSPMAQAAWLALGSVALGCGIWGMHFIGMLAYRIPIPVSYDLGITAFSFMPAAAASGVMLFVIGRMTLVRTTVIAAGGIFGIGVAVMHFTGMAAMQMNAVMLYRPDLFAVSIISVMGLAILAVAVFTLDHTQPGKRTKLSTAISAMIFGAAVSGMHYTAMAAVVTFPAASGQAVQVAALTNTKLRSRSAR
jgi:NO-binding membrane sensor protein with MHYT domain